MKFILWSIMDRERQKVCILTGATGDLGYETAQHLSEQGYVLRLVGRNQEKLFHLLAQLQEISPDTQHTVYSCDVTNHHDIDMTLSQIFAESEIPSILINGSAILEDPNKLHNYDDALITKVLDTNLAGTIMMTKGYITRLLSHDLPGDIITWGSTAGLYAYPYRSIYAATKAGLKHFMESIALEYKKKGINISYLCPGPIQGDAINKVIEDRAQLRNIPLQEMTKTFSHVVSDDGTFVPKEKLFLTIDQILNGQLKKHIGEDITGHTLGIDTIGIYDMSNPRAIKESKNIKNISPESAIQYDQRRYLMKWSDRGITNMTSHNPLIRLYQNYGSHITNYGVAAMLALIIGGTGFFGNDYMKMQQKNTKRSQNIQAACAKYGVDYQTYMDPKKENTADYMALDLINREAYRNEVKEETGFDIGGY